MLYQKHLTVKLLAVAALLVAAVCPVLGGNLKILPGHVPAVVSHLTPKGRLAATNELELTIGLPLRDSAGLDRFLAELYDPASPQYHQFITPEEVSARFGPTDGDYETLKNFARTNGLTVTTGYKNRLVLNVRGPVAAIEQAFHLTLRTYRHPSEARDFFAPDTEPTVDSMVPVADIQGLSDYGRPQPKLYQMSAQTSQAVAKNGSAPTGSGSFFGNDFRNAFVPGTTLTGAGQSVGLFEADGFYASDIAAYAASAGNGRSNIVIQTVTMDGFSGTPTTGSSSGNGEVSLDIEMAMAIAPGLTKIVVYEGNPNNFRPNDILNSMLSGSNTVKNLSSSWGWSGGPSTSTDNIFKNMAAAGQSFFNASGDSCAFTVGASSTNGVDNTSRGNAPSSSPYITQVGATTLTMNGTGGSYSSETVWNWGNEIGSSYNGVGSSGGVSSYYAIPAWQTNVSTLTSSGGSTTSRNIPDVAMPGDNIYVAYGNGTSGSFGGTSCAAPLWAGFIALANQQAVASGKAVVGFVNPALYTIAAGSGYATCFHDVTTGNNTWSSSPSQYNAGSGYDLCAGLGTPGGTNLINALVPGSSSQVITEPLAISPLNGTASGVAGGPFVISSGSVVLTNTGTSSLNWSLINTATWLSVSTSSGTLAANAQTQITYGFTASASSLPVGTYSTTLTYTDLTTHVVQAGQFTLSVSQPLAVSPTTGFTASGPIGGPFNVTSQNLLLTNGSTNSLAWNFANVPAWLSIPASGTLAGSAQSSITVSLAAMASSLGAGTYTASVLVTNFAGVAATLPFTLNVGGSIVNNGGFETGDFTGWTLNGQSTVGKTIYDGAVSSGTFTGASNYIHSGTYGVVLGQSGSLGYLYQTLATTPGQSYLVSVWVANPTNTSTASPNQFLVQWNGTTLFNQTNLPFSGWTNLQFAVTATGTGTVLQLGFEDTPYYLALDDVSVVPITPPAFKTALPATSGFNLTLGTTIGQVYQVQYTTNLIQPNWVNLGSSLTATGSSLTVQDTNATPASPGRFYRIEQDPP